MPASLGADREFPPEVLEEINGLEPTIELFYVHLQECPLFSNIS